MSKTIEEMIKEVLSDEELGKELMSALNEPSQVADFLKAHGCYENVNEFIACLDKVVARNDEAFHRQSRNQDRRGHLAFPFPIHA